MDTRANLEPLLPTLARYLNKVRELYPVEAVYLFGSYATGQPREESDIDLAIVSPGFSGSRLKDGGKLSALTWSIDTRIEPWGFRPEDFTEDHVLPSIILRHGIRIDQFLAERES